MNTYVVIDNSQQLCFETNRNEHLAGTHYNEKALFERTVDVLVQPFKRKYRFLGAEHEEMFIIGRCYKGLTHIIMYLPKN